MTQSLSVFFRWNKHEKLHILLFDYHAVSLRSSDIIWCLGRKKKFWLILSAVIDFDAVAFPNFPPSVLDYRQSLLWDSHRSIHRGQDHLLYVVEPASGDRLWCKGNSSLFSRRCEFYGVSLVPAPSLAPSLAFYRCARSPPRALRFSAGCASLSPSALRLHCKTRLSRLSVGKGNGKAFCL